VSRPAEASISTMSARAPSNTGVAIGTPLRRLLGQLDELSSSVEPLISSA
jgi:hypothetical protein